MPRSASANASVTQKKMCRATVKAIQTASPMIAPTESPSMAAMTAMTIVTMGTTEIRTGLSTRT